MSSRQLCGQTSSYTAQDSLPQQRIMCAQMSVVPPLRNPDLVQTYQFFFEFPWVAAVILALPSLSIVLVVLLRSLLYWSSWVCIQYPHFLYPSGKGKIFLRPHVSENVVSTPLPYKIVWLCREFSVRNNYLSEFKKYWFIVFFSFSVLLLKYQMPRKFYYFETFFLLEAQRIFFPIGLFLSICWVQGSLI